MRIMVRKFIAFSLLLTFGFMMFSTSADAATMRRMVKTPFEKTASIFVELTTASSY